MINAAKEGGATYRVIHDKVDTTDRAYLKRGRRRFVLPA